MRLRTIWPLSIYCIWKWRICCPTASYAHVCHPMVFKFSLEQQRCSLQHSTNDGRKGCSKLQGSPLVLRHRPQRGHAAGRLGLLVALASKISVNTGEIVTPRGIPLISGGYFQRVGPKVIKTGSAALRLNQQCPFRRILLGNLFASSGKTGK